VGALQFVVPGDPETLTGGNIEAMYDVRIAGVDG
jgi:hypothetical protein